MYLHTWTFALFFAGFYAVYWLLRNSQWRWAWFLAASCVFFGWGFHYAYPLLLLYTAALDYGAVLGMSRFGRPTAWLWLSVAGNLAMLAYFKYMGFFEETANAALVSAGLGFRLHVPAVVLEVSVSFFVFQSMTYTIDYYRGRIARETSFLRYAAFVASFPQLGSGPIERAANLLPQLRGPARITAADVGDGLSLAVVGLFKKIALADYLALYVNPVYDNPGRYPAAALALATVAYAWQIYFDFSGYTDIARGVARLVGLKLSLNFDNPYLATGLGDFWRRWHVSLSTWFKDYLYIPLGGNRHGKLRTHLNMCLTMIVSGLWHGAAWTYVLWGAVHALARVLTRELEQKPFYQRRVPTAVKQALTFCLVCLAWVFFRARSVGDAWLIVRRIFSGAWSDPRFPLAMAALVGLVWLYQFAYESRLRPLLERKALNVALVVLMIVYLATLAGSGGKAFIYAQF
jgi:D-alanyl-lipoteichoic acid acyltransferase DltB (MBOAT superfamily)